MPNTDILDEIIIGRVKPSIYAFSTNTIPNYLKVGDTYRPVSERLKEWAARFPNLQKKYEGSAQINDSVYFRDFAIHSFLERERNRQRLRFEDISKDIYFSREFFKNATENDIIEAVADIRADYENGTGKYSFYNPDTRLPEETHYVRNQTFEPRPNQQDTIDKFNIARNHGRTNLLMYAVMRFGKSFTSMCCAVEMGAKLVVVTSAKADVLREWKKTVESHVKFVDYDFVCSTDLTYDNHIVTNKLNAGKKVVVFLTLQDLQGDNIKEKHQELFGCEIDLLLIDETHFGARAAKYGEVLRAHGLEKDVNEKLSREEQETLENYNEIIDKSFDAKIRIHLSGTPYKILMGSEFTKDDIIAFYQFTDIVADQEAWNREYLLDDNYKEWDNPYYGFPQMVRFAFCPNESSLQRLDELRKSGITYALSALFKPQSIRKDVDGKHKKFEYEQEVFELLQTIDGSKADTNVLGFLDYDKIKDGNMCKHIVMVLPYCAACDAMETLITENKTAFHNLGEYKIVNISGIDNTRLYRTPDDVKLEIERHEKTITLTVNRMLTGSTVPQWDTMIYLKDTASPQEYDQAIFRLQSQYIKTFVNETGDIIKFNMKPQTLLVDFDPNRMFLMQEQKAQVYNVNIDEAGNSKAKLRLEEELRISPIVVLNNDRIVRVSATDILQAVSNYQNNRGIIEEALETPVDLNILLFDEVKQVIDLENQIGSKAGLSIRANERTENNDEDGDDNGELNIPEVDDGNSPDTTTPPATNGHSTNVDEKAILTKKIQSYYTRMLLFAFVTNDVVISLQDIVEKFDTTDNKRIAQNLGLSKEVLNLFNTHCNKWILRKLDYKIQDLNRLSHSTDISATERAEIAVRKFGKLGDAIVITPSKICDEMVTLLSDDFLKNVANNNGRILDIAGVTGEFATALYKRMSSLGIPHDKIANVIYTIPKSSICYELTRKSYEMLGLNISNIAQQFVASDLLQIKHDKNVDFDKIEKILKQNKVFSQITTNDNPQEGVEMISFDAVVGNPPYQETSGSTVNDKPIYHHFMDMAFGLSSKVSFISPARFLFNAGATPSAWNEKILSDEHFKVLLYASKSTDIFPSVDIKGGVVITFRDENSVFGKIGTYCSFAELNSIKAKVWNKTTISFSEIILNRGQYRFSDKVYADHPEEMKKTSDRRISTSAFERMPKLFTIEKPDDGNEYIQLYGNYENSRVYRWFRKDYLVPIDNLYKYKVMFPKANGSGSIGEVLITPLIGEPVIGEPVIGYTETYISAGETNSLDEAKAVLKYIKSKFARALLGILKVTQDNTKKVWEFVPMQDFTANSDIDWNKSISEIDQQLYEKYGLSPEEITFIESKIKPME